MGKGTGSRFKGWARLGVCAFSGLASVAVVAPAGGSMVLGGPSAVGGHYLRPATVSASTGVVSTFHYGFDLSSQEPVLGSGRLSLQAPTASDTAALQAFHLFSGSYVDQSMYGFGANVDPEPAPGQFDMSAIATRISMIEAVGGVPVISLIGAPAWMRPGPTGFYTPPAPQYYGAFATLCAHVAAAFPQVRYFVVWNELKGFWDQATNTWNMPAYTAMYNDVYAAIKHVRPTALVGGPYVSMTAWPTRRGPLSSLDATYGYVEKASLNAISFWLAHKVGADFVAVDGATENAKAGVPLVNAVQAAGLYSSVDRWLEQQTALPIWWMESHIAPVGWSTAEGAAARVATLAEMASSGATVGMQWQPQDQLGWPDEGLWTSTSLAGGGQETPLARVLLPALPILRDQPVLVGGEPAGVIVVSDAAGTLAVNTNAGFATAKIGGTTVRLAGSQVLAS